MPFVPEPNNHGAAVSRISPFWAFHVRGVLRVSFCAGPFLGIVCPGVTPLCVSVRPASPWRSPLPLYGQRARGCSHLSAPVVELFSLNELGGVWWLVPGLQLSWGRSPLCDCGHCHLPGALRPGHQRARGPLLAPAVYPPRPGHGGACGFCPRALGPVEGEALRRGGGHTGRRGGCWKALGKYCPPSRGGGWGSAKP